MSVHRRFCFSLVAVLLVAPLAHAQGAPAAPPAPAGPAPAPAPPAGAPPEAAPQQGPPGPYYQEPAPETPKIYVEQPPLPPTPPRNRYFHDGFYLRLSVGYGFLNTSTGLSNNDSTASLSGHGVAFDVMAGGTPAPGVVVGGGLMVQAAFDPTTSVTQKGGTVVQGLDSGASGTVGFAMLGPMIDAFPNPNGGFHLGALLGLAGVGLKSNENNVSGGVGGSIWTGYMWWATSQWSMGLMARFTLAGTSRRVGVDAAQFDATDTSAGLGITLSAVYH